MPAKDKQPAIDTGRVTTKDLDPRIYLRIFQQNGDGLNILGDLSMKFYDRPSYAPGDPHATAFNEGQRSVIAFIIQKCAEAQK